MRERARDGEPSFLGRLLWPRRPAAGSVAGDVLAGDPAGDPPGDDAVATNPAERHAPSPALAERLGAIERGLADLSRRVPLVSDRAPDASIGSDGAGPGDIAAALAALEKSVGRAGREQFKALALAQAQQEQMGAALETLRAADARREAELEAWPARAQAAREAARLEMAQALFPTLDGLDEAIRAGRHLLDQPPAPPPPSPPPPSFLDRLFPARQEATPPLEVARDEAAALREAMGAWLTGLTFVRGRLLDVLAAEGVRPIDVLGQPFDPHYHVAIDVIPPREGHDGRAPGTVAAELRRGYVADGRVLRYAEVAVVGDASTSD